MAPFRRAPTLLAAAALALLASAVPSVLGSADEVQADAVAGALGKEPTLVDFYMNGCPHCVRLSPIIDQLADKMKGKVKVIKVMASGNEQLTSTAKINGFPTLKFYDKGTGFGHGQEVDGRDLNSLESFLSSRTK